MIIGIAGLAGSGKTTIASELVMRGCMPRKFAMPLKSMLRALLHSQGMSDEMVERKVEGDLKEQPCEYLGGKTPRYVMQTLGTDWGRALIGEDFWVQAAMQSCADDRDSVFDDVRFENEANAIRAAGGVVVRLHRDGVYAESTHASENPPWSEIEVVNDGDPQMITDVVVRAIESLPS